MNKMEISVKTQKTYKKPKRNPGAFSEALNPEILKSTITEMKNSLEGFKGRFEEAEERISEVEPRTMEIMESEE